MGVGDPGRDGTNEAEPTVRMRMLQLHGAAVNVPWLLYCGEVAMLYLGLSLSPPIPSEVSALYGAVRITWGWLKTQFYLIQPLVPLQ